jgi:hypothetical protein
MLTKLSRSFMIPANSVCRWIDRNRTGLRATIDLSKELRASNSGHERRRRDRRRLRSGEGPLLYSWVSVANDVRATVEVIRQPP